MIVLLVERIQPAFEGTESLRFQKISLLIKKLRGKLLPFFLISLAGATEFIDTPEHLIFKFAVTYRKEIDTKDSEYMADVRQ